MVNKSRVLVANRRINSANKLFQHALRNYCSGNIGSMERLRKAGYLLDVAKERYAQLVKHDAMTRFGEPSS